MCTYHKEKRNFMCAPTIMFSGGVGEGATSRGCYMTVEVVGWLAL